MSDLIYANFKTDSNHIELPEILKNKDSRADMPVRACVMATQALLEKLPSSIDLNNTNIVVVSRKGCEGHIRKVAEGIDQKKARHGFFVRGGPQTLATYTALAFGIHGAAFSAIGDESSIEEIFSMVSHMMNINESEASILIYLTHPDKKGYQAKSIFLNRAISAEDFSNKQFKLISKESV